MVKKKIKVQGDITLRGRFMVELDMTEAEFDALSVKKQNELIEDHIINWLNWVDNADVDTVDVDEVDEIEETEKGAGE